MSMVFADTAYFIAHFSRTDQYDRKALELSDRLRGRMVTTDDVLLELADGFADTRYRSRVRPLISHLRNSAMSDVIPASPESLESALDLYHKFGDKQWTLTDCTCFIFMRERGITEALTGDHPFEQAGFIALLK